MTFPPPPRGTALTDEALARWLDAMNTWGKDQDKRVLALENAPEPEAAVAEDPDDGTGFASFAHISGGAGLAAHWNVAAMVTGNGLTTYYSPAANTFYAVPFIAPKRGGSIEALAYDSNVATGNSRIAVYTNTSPAVLYPDELLGESGSKANTAASTIVSTTGLSLGPLTPGELYWLAYVNDNVAASVRKLDPGACSGMLGAPLAQISTPPGIKVAFTYAAPPSTFPAGGTYINTSSDFAPALGYRVSA